MFTKHTDKNVCKDTVHYGHSPETPQMSVSRRTDKLRYAKDQTAVTVHTTATCVDKDGAHKHIENNMNSKAVTENDSLISFLQTLLLQKEKYCLVIIIRDKAT